MPVPAELKRDLEKTLWAYCQHRVPVNIRDQVRVDNIIRGNSITLFEERPVFTRPDEWTRINIAQFRFDPRTAVWTLYWSDRNSRWHVYPEVSPTARFEELLREVDDDPTAIFWG